MFSGEKTLAPDKQSAVVDLLNLNGEQRSLFYDLAAEDRGEVPTDIAGILVNKECRREIRMKYLRSLEKPNKKKLRTEKSKIERTKKPSKKLSVPCCYQGGKQRVSKEVVDSIFQSLPNTGDHTYYYDVCCGSGAFTVELLNRGVNASNITMIDISSWGSFWNLLGSGNFDMDTFDRYLAAVPEDKSLVKDHMIKLAQEDALVDEQYKYILLQACSFGGKQIWRDGSIWRNAFFRSYWKPTATSVRRSPANPMQPCPATLRKRVAELVDSAKGLTCVNADVLTLFDWDIADNSVIYIDPPYRDTTAYAFGFDVDEFIASLKSHTKAAIFVSEGIPLSGNAKQLVFGGAKGGISGNKRGKHEEWLSYV
ncbi:MAG: class I SAM-dependent methyltransferase [Christensenellaceae bacterium]